MTASARSGPEQDLEGDRILVLLDASPGSLAALRTAATLAELLRQRLEALFVEDINLLYLAGLPFTREVGSYTAALRALDAQSVEREYRLRAQQLRHAVEMEAAAHRLEWEFRVVRGGVREQAVQAAKAATFVGMGRVGRYRLAGQKLGSTAQALLELCPRPLVVGGWHVPPPPPSAAERDRPDAQEPQAPRPTLVVSYTGSDAARRALALALALAERRAPPLVVAVAAEMVRAHSAERALQEALGGRSIPSGVAALPERARLRDFVQRTPHAILLLPADAASSLADFDTTVIVVP